ncbi:MAG: hypothetical protein WD669_05700 [Pirellulales bacterium]
MIARSKLVVFLSIVCVSTSLRADEVTDKTALNVIAEGFDNNRASFPHVDCKFDMIKTQSNSVADGLAGQFTGERTVLHGAWLVNGTDVRHELLCDEATASEVKRILKAANLPKGGGEVSVPGWDHLYLRNDAYKLGYSPMNLSANLSAAMDSGSAGVRITPFNLDIFGADEISSPTRYIREGLLGRFAIKFNGTEKINGRDLLVVLAGDGLRAKFGFDPLRGYMLAYAADKNIETGERSHELFVTDARECSGGRWFPTKIVKFLVPDASKRPLYTNLIEVTKLDVDTPPDKSRFNLDLAKGVQVAVLDRLEYINLSEAESVSVDNLGSLDERIRKYGAERAARKAAALQNLSSASQYRVFMVIVNLGVVVALLFVVVRRIQRRGV